MAGRNQSSKSSRQSKSHKSDHAAPKSHGRRATTPGGKVGDSAQAARRVGGKGDFGARESDTTERAYASAATRHQDKGGAVERSGTDGGRTSGVGGNESGVGSSSGGDVDTDIVGVGTGGSTVSASGKVNEPSGPDDSDGSSNEFASPVPKDRAVKTIKGRGGRNGAAKLRGSTVDRSGGDASTTGNGQGTSAVTNPEARNDDSFAAEISNDEAAGADNSMSDNE